MKLWRRKDSLACRTGSIAFQTAIASSLSSRKSARQHISLTIRKDVPCDGCAQKGLECLHHAVVYGLERADPTKIRMFGCLPCRSVHRKCTPDIYINAFYGISGDDDGVEDVEHGNDSGEPRRTHDAGGGEEEEHAEEVDGVDYDDVEDDSVEDDGSYYDDDSHYGSGLDSGDDGEGGNRDDADPASSTRGTKRRMGKRTMEPAKRPKMYPSPATNNTRSIAQRSVTSSPDPSTSETERPRSPRIVEHAATSSRTMASDELRIKDLEDKLRSKTKLVQRQMRKISELETSHQRLEIIEEGHRRRIQQLQDENAALSEEANKSKNEAIKAMEHVIKAKDETLRAKDEVLKAKAEVLRDKDPKRSAADDAKGAKMGQLQAELRSFQLRHVWELPSIDDVMSHALEPSHAACPVDVEGVRYQRRPIIKYSIENMAAIGCVPKMIFQDLPYFL